MVQNWGYSVAGCVPDFGGGGGGGGLFRSRDINLVEHGNINCMYKSIDN